MSSFTFKKTGHLGIITYERPPVNAFIYNTYKECGELFLSIQNMDDIYCVLLRAEGKWFTPGNDVNDFEAFSDTQKAKDYQKMVAWCFSKIYECDVPIVCAVQGYSLGAGLCIASCCDIIVASEDAKFGIPEITAGIIGATGWASIMVPEKMRRYLALTGKHMSAEEMHQLGAVLKVVSREKLDEVAMETVNEVMMQGPMALRGLKKAMRTNDDLRLVEKYMEEAKYTLEYAKTADFKETIKQNKASRQFLYPFF